MSKSNYRRCVSIGVTGKHTNTCFPASVDKLLPGQRVDPDAYLAYEDLMRNYLQTPQRQRNPALKKMYQLLAQEIDADEFQFTRVRSREELCDVVSESFHNGLKIILDLHVTKDVVHAVGLEAHDRRKGHYTLTSTHVPHSLRGIVTLGYIFPNLSQLNEPPRIIYPFNDANVTIVPSA